MAVQEAAQCAMDCSIRVELEIAFIGGPHGPMSGLIRLLDTQQGFAWRDRPVFIRIGKYHELQIPVIGTVDEVSGGAERNERAVIYGG